MKERAMNAIIEKEKKIIDLVQSHDRFADELKREIKKLNLEIS